MKRPENKFGGEIRKKNFYFPINQEKWLEKVKVDKVQCKQIISETVMDR